MPKTEEYANTSQVKSSSSRNLWLSISGALVGGLLATWLAPKMIVWYFDPPAELGFSCRAPIEWSLKRFQISQLVGIFFGGLLGLIASLTILRKKKAPELTAQ